MNSDEVQFIPAEAADLINLFFISFLYFIRSAINTRYLFLEGNHEAYAVGKFEGEKE